MADIREYQKLHNHLHMVSPQESQEAREAQGLIRKHHKRLLLAAAGCVIVLTAAFFALRAWTDNLSYEGYVVSRSLNRDDSASAKYVEYKGGFLRYSEDGISVCDMNGKSLWNHTYSMKNPQVAVCEDKAVVADINGTAILTFNEKGYMGSIDTAMPVSQVLIGNKGLVVAVLEDENANYINMYGTDGSKIYSIKTSVTGDGYPLNVAITGDGTKLMASFLYVSGEHMKTNVVFYNFSDVGKNETQRLVGGFNHYDSTIVPEVQFVTDKCAVAVGENVLSIYTITEYPHLQKEIPIESPIEKVFYDDQYIGIVTRNKEGTDNFKLTVYNTSGSEKFSLLFNTEYSVIKFDKKGILMYNESVFSLVNLSGKVQFSKTLDMPIEAVLSTGSKGRYILVSSKYIQEIRLK